MRPLDRESGVTVAGPTVGKPFNEICGLSLVVDNPATLECCFDMGRGREQKLELCGHRRLGETYKVLVAVLG